MFACTPLPNSPTRGRRCLTSQTAVHSRRRWSGLTEEPGIEKAVQIPACNLLSHSDKILGCHVASGMAGHILTQHLEKRLLADFAAQCVKGHWASLIDAAAEKGAGVGIRRRPIDRSPDHLPELLETAAAGLVVDRDHQDPQTTGLCLGRTDHPLGTPIDPASSPALALGGAVQPRPRPTAGHSTPSLTAPVRH